MDVRESMATVVQVPVDASMTVTLLNGARKCMLMHNTVHRKTVILGFSDHRYPSHVHSVKSHPKSQECTGTDTHSDIPRCNKQTRCNSNAHSNSGAQEPNGRYTSVYKTAHCHISPTSPQVELTEFPPQRAEICPGSGNFEVGGAGSGDTYSSIKINNNQGRMCRADRASYNMRSQLSSSRLPEATSSHTFDQFLPKNASQALKTHDESPSRGSVDDTPTKDCRPKKHNYDYTEIQKAVFRHYDVRYLREVSKRERNDFESMPSQISNSVNMEIQATVEMTSKGVATVTKPNPSKRDMAVPLSPAVSTNNGDNHGGPCAQFHLYKQVQTAASINNTSLSLGLLTSVKTSSSFADLPTRDKYQCNHGYRKSKSEEELNFKNDRISQCKTNTNKTSISLQMKSGVQSTEKEIKSFVREILFEFLIRTHLKTCPKCLKEAETELIDVFIDSTSKMQMGDDIILKNDIFCILFDKGCIPEYQAMPLADTLFERYKLYLNVNGFEKNRLKCSRSFVVFQNTEQISPQTSNNTEFYSLDEVSARDLESYLNSFIKQLNQVIDAWLTKVLGTELNFAREEVINNLTSDIVDRLKYFSKNPALRTTEIEELEVLKYQIFKWVYKLGDKDAIDETIEHVPDLIARIQSIPTPIMFSKNNHSYLLYNTPPSCCESQSSVETKQNVPKTSLKGDLLEYPNINNYLRVPYFQPQVSNTVDDMEPNFDNLHPLPHTQNISPTQVSVLGPSNPSDTMDEPSERKCMTREAQYLSPTFNPVPVQQNFCSRRYDSNEKPLLGISDARALGISRPVIRKMCGPEAINLETNAENRYQPDFGSSGRITTGQIIKQNIPLQTNQTDNSIDLINSQYDEYLQNWVNKIPLPVSTNAEKTLADTIRRGFYNGVWKAILKVKLDPVKYTERIYYQSVLDAEIQELFDLLPKTAELESKKNVLKANLLQKTIDTVEIILAKSKSAIANYRRQLIEQVTNHIPSKVRICTDSQTDRYEELQKLLLIDAFILYISFRETDLSRAKTYKKKLNQCLSVILQTIKDKNELPFENRNLYIYKNEIMIALDTVPRPSLQLIQDEADKILLGIEIEKWYDDLPFVPNNILTKSLDRRRIRNTLGKQIYEITGKMKSDDYTFELVKSVAMEFLQKLPLHPGHKCNLNFIAEELANRLKNKSRENAALRQMSVSYDVPNLFIDFERDVPGASSRNEINMLPDLYQSDLAAQQIGGNSLSDSIENHTISYRPTPQLLTSVHKCKLTQPLLSSDEQKEGVYVCPRQQVLSRSQVQAGNIIHVPESQSGVIQMSLQGSVPVTQQITTREALVLPKEPNISWLSSLQRSKHVVFAEPEIPVTSPQIVSGGQQTGHTSAESFQQSTPIAPIGIQRTSQTTDTSEQLRGNSARRYLFFDDYEEPDSKENHCRCMEREHGCRRRRTYYDCNNCCSDYPRFVAIKYPHVCFF